MYQLCGTYPNSVDSPIHARGEVRGRQMKEKTISQLLEEVANEICNNYCKYMRENCSDEEFDKILDKHCSNCPLNKLQ